MLPTLGYGNRLTIAGLMLALLAGFIFSPRPPGGWRGCPPFSTPSPPCSIT
ncbi:MAG: hypothetical protein R2851_16415 [Caldilineaceae bacterium]